MSLFNELDENKRDSAENASAPNPGSESQADGVSGDAPEQKTEQPPENGYWAKNTPSRDTTPSGYGQGYQNPQPPYGEYPPYGANQGYPPYPPKQGYGGNPYQYNPNSGWQQPPQQRVQENYQWNFQDYDKASNSANAGQTKKKKSRGLVVFVVSVICVLAASLVGLTIFGIVSQMDTGFAQGLLDNSEAAGSSSAAPDTAAHLEIASRPQISESLPIGEKMTIPQVAKAVSPSVVGVIQYQPNMTIAETGEGSGIIMSADGYVITNAHVVAGGTDFKVILHDGTPKDADLIGADTITDLAVLKINDAGDLTPAVFGDSSQIEVGEQVIAIGNPGGKTLAGSVTQGIISAVNREIPNAANLPINMPLIQTDAAINPGNSGGALVNEYGQVIGINSSKIVAAGFEGIGFAIPISEAKPIIDDIVQNGRVTGRVRLGISAYEIDEIDARNLGLQMGIRIESIDEDSDLNNKGIQKFDVITHIDGERVFTMYDLKSILEMHKPGDRITLTLYRPLGGGGSNNAFDVMVTLMEDK